MAWDSFDQIYEYIGRFCVDFEQFNRSMEASIRNLFDTKGLTDTSIQVILLAGYTAEPLRALLQNLIGEVLADDSNKVIFSKAFSRLQNLIQERNDLIHSKWFLYGNVDENEQAEFLAEGERLHANKGGKAVKDFKLEKEKVEQLINQCKEASIIVSLITRCILELRTVDECFSIKENQLVINYEALKPDTKPKDQQQITQSDSWR